MGTKKAVPIAYAEPVAAIGTAPVEAAVWRLFGLSAGDWSMFFIGLALACSLLLLT